MICDWCGKKADGMDVFQKLRDYVNTPVVCDECYWKYCKEAKAYAPKVRA